MPEEIKSVEAMPPVKAIVFDFDGVVVRRSEFFKHAAWVELFKGNAAQRKRFEEAEEKFGQGRGGDRYDILRFVLQDGNASRNVETEVQELTQRFDAIVQEKMFRAGVDEADRAVFGRLSRKYALYVNSATPQEALEHTIENLGLAGIFRGILGRPLSKRENFEHVAELEGIMPGEILFVGDGESDYKASMEAACRFLGYHNEWNNWKEGEQTFPVIRSLADIENWTQ